MKHSLVTYINFLISNKRTYLKIISAEDSAASISAMTFLSPSQLAHDIE